MTADRSTVPARATNIAWQVIDGELVILRIDADELVGINEVGATVWDLVDGKRSVDGIAGEIAAHYDVDRDTALRDTDTFLHELEDMGAVDLHNRAAGR